MGNNWCIKLDDKNRDVVIKYLNEKFRIELCDIELYGDRIYYGVYCNNIYCDDVVLETEINIKQFIEKIKLEGYNVDYRESINKYYLVTQGYKSEILSTSTNNPPINKFLSELDNDTQNVFDKTLSSLADLLKYKNTKYGNSVLDPLEIFKGKCKAGDRIDDKLSRIKTSKELRKNDVSDLIGYLVLTCVENNWDNFDEFKD